MGDGETGVVDAHPRICSNCEHGALGQFGVYCTEFNETIVDEESVARKCELYEPVQLLKAPPRRQNDRSEGPKSVLELGALVDMCEAFLEGHRCTLWGGYFIIHEPVGREEAARWLADQIRGVLTAPVPMPGGGGALSMATSAIGPESQESNRGE